MVNHGDVGKGVCRPLGQGPRGAIALDHGGGRAAGRVARDRAPQRAVRQGEGNGGGAVARRERGGARGVRHGRPRVLVAVVGDGDLDLGGVVFDALHLNDDARVGAVAVAQGAVAYAGRGGRAAKAVAGLDAGALVRAGCAVAALAGAGRLVWPKDVQVVVLLVALFLVGRVHARDDHAVVVLRSVGACLAAHAGVYLVAVVGLQVALAVLEDKILVVVLGRLDGHGVGRVLVVRKIGAEGELIGSRGVRLGLYGERADVRGGLGQREQRGPGRRHHVPAIAELAVVLAAAVEVLGAKAVEVLVGGHRVDGAEEKAGTRGVDDLDATHLNAAKGGVIRGVEAGVVV